MNEKTFSKRLKNEFKKSGWTVIDMEGIGNGVPDCLVIKKHFYVLLEFKYGTGDPRKQLTQHQKVWIKNNSKNTYIYIVSKHEQGRCEIMNIDTDYSINYGSIKSIVDEFNEKIILKGGGFK